MNNTSAFALSAFVTILGRLLLGEMIFHKFLFYGLLFLASGALAVVAPKLIRCKKDLDREKGLVHDLERVATADGSGRLATAIRSFLSALYDSYPRKRFSYTYALFFAFGDTERLEILERVHASLLFYEKFCEMS